MRASDVLRALVLPLSNFSVLLAIIIFYVLYQLAFLLRHLHFVLALVLGAQLVVFVLPALLRYLMQLLEARARGADLEPLTAETLTWIGNTWSLFPLVTFGGFAYAVYTLDGQFGTPAAATLGLLLTLVTPASLAILAVTHTPLHSVRPGAIVAVIRRSGLPYLLAPGFVAAAVTGTWWLQNRLQNDFLTEFIAFYLLFAAFVLFGEVVRPQALHDEVDIYEPLEPDQQLRDDVQVQERTMILNHAYGFASRGNVIGALGHLYKELDKDPDSATGWPWYLEKMLQWDDVNPALMFAQQYLKRLLQAQEYVAAMKLITRCRLINEAFRPLPEDRELALEAAEACHNDELIRFLR